MTRIVEALSGISGRLVAPLDHDGTLAPKRHACMKDNGPLAPNTGTTP